MIAKDLLRFVIVYAIFTMGFSQCKLDILLVIKEKEIFEFRTILEDFLIFALTVHLHITLCKK
jgi:hypothetical protein